MTNGRCHYHGGKSLAGIASPRFKEGKYSKVMPSRMREAFTEAVNDPQLLEQRKEIGLLDARLIDLLGRVDTGESGVIWTELKKHREELRVAQLGRDTPGQIIALNAILEAIDRGYTDYRAWGELASVLEQRRRLVESERKRLVEMQQMVTSQQAMALITALLESVKRNVRDRDSLAAIQADFIRLTTHDDRTIVDVG